MLDIERLRKAKKEKKLSYDELAQLTGLSRSTITNIFCGYIDLPRHETVQSIERALGLAPTFTDEERALGLSDTHLIALSDNDRELINLFAEAEEKLGQSYVRGVKQMVRIAIDTKGQP